MAISHHVLPSWERRLQAGRGLGGCVYIEAQAMLLHLARHIQVVPTWHGMGDITRHTYLPP